MGKTLALTSLLLLTLGAAPHLAASNVRNTDVNRVVDTESNPPIVDCSGPPAGPESQLQCEFLRQAVVNPYHGPVLAVARRVQIDDAEAWVMEPPMPAPFLPADSCDPEQPQKCGEAVKSACKSIGKPNGSTTYKVSWLIAANGQKWNSCSGTCSDGSYVYVSCVSPQM